jgi:ATP-dependent Clp protease, protease subunit
MGLGNIFRNKMKKIEEFNASDRIDLKLLNNGTHILFGDIDQDSINSAIKWILYENFEAKEKKILTLYVNSTGGDLYQAFALIDIMRSSKHSIRTIGIGSVMSAAFLIFASGTKGQRYATKNASFMCHQFSESTEGKYHDIKATMRENDLCNQKMVDILKEATGMPVARIKSKLLPASDVYLTASEMVDFAVADHII